MGCYCCCLMCSKKRVAGTETLACSIGTTLMIDWRWTMVRHPLVLPLLVGVHQTAWHRLLQLMGRRDVRKRLLGSQAVRNWRSYALHARQLRRSWRRG